MQLALSSSAFKNGAAIPRKYTGVAEDISPPLSWTDVPASTRSLALLCEDPDAPGGLWVHWVLYDIPPEVREIGENLDKSQTVLGGSAKQGLNDFRGVGYGGPMPPPGKAHRYMFKLYALDQPTGLPAKATRSQLLKAIEGHVLAQTQLTGLFGR